MQGIAVIVTTHIHKMWWNDECLVKARHGYFLQAFMVMSVLAVAYDAYWWYHAKNRTNEGTCYLMVLCKANGPMKKFKKRIIPLLCILGRKRWDLKLSKFVNGRKIKHENILGTYINFIISAVGSIIKMHFLCCNDFQITQMIKLSSTTCPPFLESFHE